ncbi:HAMP domain-containing protein [uncultured Clostridium sp.]|uniref:HAMP domain-containing protein n=1 Tax=uncultured Clostridium sp. TaxID=59620 RepID=UPI0025D5DDE5|nr:HAMP domain-containing protein [uncultured Clostridium sp.]
MEKKRRARIFFLLMLVVFVFISMFFILRPKNNDYIMGNSVDKYGNIYLLSYDEKNIYLKKVSPDKNILWINSMPKSENNIVNSLNSIIVTDEGNVIMYLYKYDSNTYKKVTEQMYLYSQDGKEKRIILDDRIDLGVEQTIYSMNYYDGNVYYFQMSSKEDDTNQLVDVKKINLNSNQDEKLPESELINTIGYDSSVGINNLVYTRDNSIVFTTYDSEIYKVSDKNIYEKLYPIDNEESKGISGFSYDSNNNIYFQEISDDNINCIDIYTKDIKRIYDNKKLKHKGLDYSELKKIKFISKDKFYGTRSLDSNKSENFVTIYDKGEVKNFNNLKYSYKIILFRIVAVLCVFIAVIVILSLIRKALKIFNKNKLTISLKQTIVFIPIIIVSVLIIAVLSERKITKVVNQQLIEQIFAISKDKADSIDGDVLKAMNWDYPYNDEFYSELNAKLELGRKDEIIYNYIKKADIKDPHNSIYNLLYIVKDDEIYTGICDFNFVNIPIRYIYSNEDCKAYEKSLLEKEFVYTELKDSAGEWLALISPIEDSDGNVVALIEVGITKQGFLSSMVSENVQEILIVNILSGVFMILSLIICINYLLWPLKKLKIGVMDLMQGNLGVQVAVSSRDEVAEISEAFNKMSNNLKIDMDNLIKLNDAYHRFVPLKMFEILNKKDILDVKIGDQVKTNIALLSLTTNNFKELSKHMNTGEIFLFINKIFSIIVPLLSNAGGVVERYNNSGLIALYPRNVINAIKSAITIKETIRVHEDNVLNKINIGFVINKEEMMLGIVGCEERFGASVVSDYLTIVEGLNQFGDKYGISILVTENSIANIKSDLVSYNYREIGYIKYKSKNQEVRLYDFFDGDDYEIVKLKKQTKELFEKGVKAYYKKDFYMARKIFIEVLKVFQEDKVSKEYLQLCDKYYKNSDYVSVGTYLELF